MTAFVATVLEPCQAWTEKNLQAGQGGLQEGLGASGTHRAVRHKGLQVGFIVCMEGRKDTSHKELKPAVPAADTPGRQR